jgi:tRNA-splicing ligase RtcB
VVSIGRIFGQHDEKTLAQLNDVASRAETVSLMADGHLGYIMPIGGVAAYDEKVSVCGVGFDIACGNAAIRTDKTLPDLAGFTRSEAEQEPWRVLNSVELAGVADAIWEQISFGVGRKNQSDDAPVDHDLFDDEAWEAIPRGNYRDSLMHKARTQLGTVGSGNHYVDLFVDEEDRLWVGVHFGSRGFGHTVASDYLSLSQGGERGQRMKEVEVLLPLDSEIGSEYWALMNLAGRYAYAGREWVARKVVTDVLGAAEVDLVHNHHNFAWRETHLDRDYIVVRKGATPAFPGQRGFVGGSMGDNAVIVEGSNENGPDQVAALYSTVHGAGRVMSRTQAAGKVNRKTGEIKSPGLVSWDMLNEWLTTTGVVLRGGGLDESPHAYRRLPDVLEAQGDTICVLHTLKPLVVAMAGANEYDPYKD